MDWHRHFLRGIGRSHVALNVALRGESKPNCSYVGSGNDRVSGSKVAATWEKYCWSIEFPWHLACGYDNGIAFIAGWNRRNVVEAEAPLRVSVGLFKNEEIPNFTFQRNYYCPNNWRA